MCRILAVTLLWLVATAAPGGAAESGDGNLTPTNAETLRPVFTLATGSPGAHTAPPVLAGQRLLVLTPFPHTLLAIDIAAAGAPVAWRYTPQADDVAAGLVCCGEPEGGVTVVGDRALLATRDGHVVALDLADGCVVWDSRVAQPGQGETLAGAPMPAGDRLVVGNGGDDFGARGWVAALDPADGHVLWKRFSTGSDADVGIDKRFAQPHGADLGVTSWPPSAWQQGGGGLVGVPVYDAATRLLFLATGHPAPWNPLQRSGDNLWTSGLFARDPSDGSAVWFAALHPHDRFSRGAGGGLVAAELDWQGGRRAVLVHPDHDGRVYVLDRRTGVVLAADPFLPIAGETQPLSEGSTARGICPAWPVGEGGEPAYSAATGLLYIAESRLCMDFEPRDASYLPGTPYTGAYVRTRPAGRAAGALIAWDVVTRRPAWQVDERFPLLGGVELTAGGVLSYGTLDGTVKALDARDGGVLWQQRLGSGVVARPTAFQGPDGHAWLAVLAGAGPVAGMPAPSEMDLRDATAVKGLAGVLHDLPPPAEPGGRLTVFRAP